MYKISKNNAIGIVADIIIEIIIIFILYMVVTMPTRRGHFGPIELFDPQWPVSQSYALTSIEPVMLTEKFKVGVQSGIGV